ncbi:triose-phosphate isomerase [Candidatus Woesearchaeota archaeon]|nr:triose-phosphate isomerase [Candidatus Woesearchaeota archaeon]
MKKGLILVNFKDYKQAIGKNAIKLAKILDQKNVWLIVNPIDLKEVIKSVKHSKVLIDHADPVEKPPKTGSITFPEVKSSKAYGVLLNHSEKRIPFKDIKKGIILAKKYKLKIIVSSNNLSEAVKISKLRPDYIAIEPPELISSKTSVSKAKPLLIKNSAEKIPNLIIGAGIHSTLDVKKAREYGVIGVLVSSAIVKSKKPKQILTNLIKGL